MSGKHWIISGIRLIFMLITCIKGQTMHAQSKECLQHNRNPYVAGQFYPGDKVALTDTLRAMLNRAMPQKCSLPVVAVIAPHAGYIFSGTVAASAFNQIERKAYKHIFIIGSSHRMTFDGASVFSSGHFITPLGTATVDMQLGKELSSRHKCFLENNDSHTFEHSLEVEVPFLQHLLGNDLNLVPIVIGTQSPKTCESIALALKPYFNRDNLFVISTDLSHYPSYSDAIKSDKRITDAIESNSPQRFFQAIEEIREKNMTNLQTSICGWTSVATLLYITSQLEGINYKLVDTKNSGDAPRGDKKQVVGYAAIAVEYDDQVATTVSLTEEDKAAILTLARTTLNTFVRDHKVPEVNKKNLTYGMLRPWGAFVTLHKHGELRGCIGNFEPAKPLYLTVQDMTIASSTRDFRFSPVRPDELNQIVVEISVLTPMKKVRSVDEITMGRDGIFLKKGSATGTFLPQVASMTGWTKEEYLGHCARDKAGIGWNGWKDADIYTFQAIVFGEKE